MTFKIFSLGNILNSDLSAKVQEWSFKLMAHPTTEKDNAPFLSLASYFYFT